MNTKYYSTKTYGNDRGLSCCFRQWKATHSHCSLLHGYSIGIKLIFESSTLDTRNWVMDFGGLKDFKTWAEYMFDHTLIIAEDDPKLEIFKKLARINKYTAVDEEVIASVVGCDLLKESKPHEIGSLCDLRIVPAVGCEAFAKLAFDKMKEILNEMKENGKSRYPINKEVSLKSVEVFEHGANSAIYEE